MNDQFTTLCLLPRDVWTEPDWTRLGYEKCAPRKVYACLTSMCTYENHSAVPIYDWEAAKKGCAITVQEMHTYPQLATILSRLAPQNDGLFVYNGVVGGFEDKRPFGIGQDLHLKTCMNYPCVEYAASYSYSLPALWGFDPDIGNGCPFTLGYFPEDDPVAARIIQEFDNWPDSRCKSMLPEGPSPSTKSIELVGLGWDMEVIGLCIGDSTQPDFSPDRIREILGENAILATVDTDDFWKWLEDDFELDDLLPVDRELPFLK